MGIIFPQIPKKGNLPTLINLEQGLVTVPFWVYWTSPKKVAIIDHIPNGWVMFNGDISHDPCWNMPFNPPIWCGKIHGTHMAGKSAVSMTSSPAGGSSFLSKTIELKPPREHIPSDYLT